MRATRALIHLDTLGKNIRLFRERIAPGVKICMAVKADAYGHGAVRVIRTAREAGVHCFGVAAVCEAAEIREAGMDVPLLLFSLPLPEEVPEVVALGLSPFVADERMIELIEREAAACGKTVGVHLKIDTGMGRIGCAPEEAPALCRKIAGSESLRLEGVCTHFPGADEDDPAFTLAQIERFRDTVEEIRRAGIDPGTVHAANSAGALRFPQARFDMVRPGIVLYGYPPFGSETGTVGVGSDGFRPVMEFESRVVFLKRVPAGFPVSYGMTYRTPRPTVIATVSAGYADGYSRALSNGGEVLIRGRRYRVAGRICMDQFMVDLGPDTDVQPLDRVTLFGPDSAGPDAEELAEHTGTISYEVTCAVGRRVPRIYIE